MRWTSLLLITALASTATAGGMEALPILHDDLAKAKAGAAARKVSVYVEVAAPW